MTKSAAKSGETRAMHPVDNLEKQSPRDVGRQTHVAKSDQLKASDMQRVLGAPGASFLDSARQTSGDAAWRR